MAYHQFRDENDQPYGSFEVFHHAPGYDEPWFDDDGEPHGEGYYWAACFPGCLWDGEPTGPFDTEAEAVADAEAINA
jgi:hypothetical protein